MCVRTDWIKSANIIKLACSVATIKFHTFLIMKMAGVIGYFNITILECSMTKRFNAILVEVLWPRVVGQYANQRCYKLDCHRGPGINTAMSDLYGQQVKIGGNKQRRDTMNKTETHGSSTLSSRRRCGAVLTLAKPWSSVSKLRKHFQFSLKRELSPHNNLTVFNPQTRRKSVGQTYNQRYLRSQKLKSTNFKKFNDDFKICFQSLQYL